jgi:hypothetical protein
MSEHYHQQYDIDSGDMLLLFPEMCNYEAKELEVKSDMQYKLNQYINDQLLLNEIIDKTKDLVASISKNPSLLPKSIWEIIDVFLPAEQKQLEQKLIEKKPVEQKPVEIINPVEPNKLLIDPFHISNMIESTVPVISKPIESIPQNPVAPVDPVLPVVIKPVAPYNELKCGYCALIHQNINELNEHIMIFHETIYDGQNRTCDTCGLAFDTDVNFYYHIDNAHIVPLPPVAKIGRAVRKIVKAVKPVDGSIPAPPHQALYDQLNQPIPAGQPFQQAPNDLIIANADGDADGDADDYDSEDDEIPLLEVPVEVSVAKPVDNIRVSAIGKYVCPICAKKYASPYYLGEHYTISHSSYSEQSKLDDRKSYTSFPGYELLERIGMIKLLDQTEINTFLDKECMICCFKYTTSSEIILKNKMSCTTDDILLKKYKKNIFNCDMKIIFEKIKITDTTIQQAIYKLKQETNEPIELSCCKDVICKSCLESHLKHLNNVICPFCKNDHNKYDQDFIQYTVPNKYNKKEWKIWWSRHVHEIFC